MTGVVLLMAQAKQTRAQFSNWLCYEASGACAAKPPPLPAGRAPGPAFEVIDRQEAELEKMLAGMKVGHKPYRYVYGSRLTAIALPIMACDAPGGQP